LPQTDDSPKNPSLPILAARATLGSDVNVRIVRKMWGVQQIEVVERAEGVLSYRNLLQRSSIHEVCCEHFVAAADDQQP